MTLSKSPESSVPVVFMPVILSGTKLLSLTAADFPMSPVPSTVTRLSLMDLIM